MTPCGARPWAAGRGWAGPRPAAPSALQRGPRWLLGLAVLAGHLLLLWPAGTRPGRAAAPPAGPAQASTTLVWLMPQPQLTPSAPTATLALPLAPQLARPYAHRYAHPLAPNAAQAAAAQGDRLHRAGPGRSSPHQTAAASPLASPLQAAPDRPVAGKPEGPEAWAAQAGPATRPAAEALIGLAAAEPAHPPASQAPLQLALPKAHRPAPPAAWASQDSRGRPEHSSGARWARAMGTAAGADHSWRAEPLADGQRLRRGSDCVVVRPARDTTLNPFNSNANGLPKQVGAC